MTEHKKIKKAVELVEMIEFILASSENSLASSKEPTFKSSDSLPFPYSGLLHSVGEIKNILQGVLTYEDHHAPEKATEEPEKDSGDFNDTEGMKDKARASHPQRSSGLAGRIRPVPEEVRGRVRELVDMIEHEELSRSNYETTGV